MPEPELDLLIVGSGATASGVAFPVAEAGWRVAVVDERPFGGTCALRGCDPKKVLVGVAGAAAHARRLEGAGIAAPPPLRWPDLMAFKREFTDPVPPEKEDAFREAGIEPLRGTARFLDAHTLRVGDRTLTARHVLIASGSRPAPLPFPGASLLTTSDEFLDLDVLPPRVAFVGGGYISMEFAHLARAMGSEVTVVHGGSHVLDGFDPDLADRLAAHARAGGVTFHLNTRATAVEEAAGGLVLHAETEGGRAVRVEADLVVHGAGRVPNLNALDLDAAGVFHGKAGVSVDHCLRSVSQPHVYAAGDCAASDGPPLTPVAGYEASVVVDNLVHGREREVDYGPVPSVAFTMPPLAGVGLSEAGAKEEGLDVEVKQGDMAEWFTYRRQREDAAAFKVILERGSGQILGAHLLGEGAPDLINLFALAMRHGLGADALRDVRWAYPTYGSNLPHLL